MLSKVTIIVLFHVFLCFVTGVPEAVDPAPVAVEPEAVTDNNRLMCVNGCNAKVMDVGLSDATYVPGLCADCTHKYLASDDDASASDSEEKGFGDELCDKKLTCLRGLFNKISDLHENTGNGNGGESSLSTILYFLKLMQLEKKSRFIDLGAGRGKVVLAAALMYECMSMGVERDETRYSASMVLAYYASLNFDWTIMLNFVHCDISNIKAPYLANFSHVYMFDAVFEQKDLVAIFSLISQSSTVRCFVSYVRPDVLVEYAGMNEFFMKEKFSGFMSGSGQQFTGYVYNRITREDHPYTPGVFCDKEFMTAMDRASLINHTSAFMDSVINSQSMVTRAKKQLGDAFVNDCEKKHMESRPVVATTRPSRAKPVTVIEELYNHLCGSGDRAVSNMYTTDLSRDASVKSQKFMKFNHILMKNVQLNRAGETHHQAICYEEGNAKKAYCIGQTSGDKVVVGFHTARKGEVSMIFYNKEISKIQQVKIANVPGIWTHKTLPSEDDWTSALQAYKHDYVDIEKGCPIVEEINQSNENQKYKNKREGRLKAYEQARSNEQAIGSLRKRTRAAENKLITSTQKLKDEEKKTRHTEKLRSQLAEVQKELKFSESKKANLSIELAESKRQITLAERQRTLAEKAAIKAQSQAVMKAQSEAVVKAQSETDKMKLDLARVASCRTSEGSGEHNITNTNSAHNIINVMSAGNTFTFG